MQNNIFYERVTLQSSGKDTQCSFAEKNISENVNYNLRRT